MNDNVAGGDLRIFLGHISKWVNPKLGKHALNSNAPLHHLPLSRPFILIYCKNVRRPSSNCVQS